MIKAIFILEKLTKEKIDKAIKHGANTIFINAQNFLTNSNYLNNWNEKVYVECPRTTKLVSIKRLIETHPIDGLWLDFIRYPCHKAQNTSMNLGKFL